MTVTNLCKKMLTKVMLNSIIITNLVDNEEDGSKIKVTSRDNQSWLKADFSKHI